MMKRQQIVFALLPAILVACSLQLGVVPRAAGYSLLLPDVAVGACESFTGLPYTALADHYTGPACIQMALNACPTVADRACHTQANLYSKVLLHNSEPTTWFSDPDGIEGTLEDPTLSPCGNWIDYSNTDKAIVLGKVLYYMRTQRYLTPVSIGTGERWVNVIGYETDVEPPFSGSVTLQNIFFYDPLPGNPSLGWVSGNTWLGVTPGSTGYWSAPHNKPGSSWHNKYIAVIEPPEAKIKVIIPRWRVRPRILPPDEVLDSVYRWLERVRERELARREFELLNRDLKVHKPLLVKGEHPYYLVRFGDDRLAAVFNAADGSFEELRLFDKPQAGIKSVVEVGRELEASLARSGVEILEAGEPQLVYDPQVSSVGRTAPVWRIEADVRDAYGKQRATKLQIRPGDMTLQLPQELLKHEALRLREKPQGEYRK